MSFRITSSRLKLAGFCLGGNSLKLWKPLRCQSHRSVIEVSVVDTLTVACFSEK